MLVRDSQTEILDPVDGLFLYGRHPRGSRVPRRRYGPFIQNILHLRILDDAVNHSSAIYVRPILLSTRRQT